jgi:AcrR family transcriptional regulator
VTDVLDVRARRRERTRADILDAAWRLADRDGIANLSLRELAAEVGMRAPSLYTYFDSKAAIFDAMFAQGYEQLDAVYAGLSIDASDPAAALADATVAFLEFCQASIPRYQLLFTRVVADWHPSPEAYAVSVASYERMVDRLAPLGVVGQRGLDLWTAITAGLAAQQLANDPTGDRWVRLSSDVAEMFLAHLRRMT